jgi:YggT family protein
LELLIVALIYFAQIMQVVVISQFVLGLLIAFNVVSLQGDIVRSIWTALNAILQPILGPIHRLAAWISRRWCCCLGCRS